MVTKKKKKVEEVHSEGSKGRVRKPQWEFSEGRGMLWIYVEGADAQYEHGHSM